MFTVRSISVAEEAQLLADRKKAAAERQRVKELLSFSLTPEEAEETAFEKLVLDLTERPHFVTVRVSSDGEHDTFMRFNALDLIERKKN